MCTLSRSLRAAPVGALAALLLAAPLARADAEAPAPDPAEAGAPPVEVIEDDTYVEEIEEEPARGFFSIGARGGAWFAKIEAEVTVTEGGLLGSELALDTDLELDEYEVIPYGEAFIRLGPVSLHGDWFRSRREGDTTLDATISFAGESFSAGTPVEAEIDIDSVGGWIMVTPFRFDSFELGVGLGVRYYRIEAAIRSREFLVDQEARERIEGPLPFAAVHMAFFPGPFEIYGQARGLYVEYEDQRDDLDITAAYLDAEVGIALNLGSHVSIGAAYKGIYLLAEEESQGGGLGDDERYEVLNHGPFAWVRIRL